MKLIKDTVRPVDAVMRHVGRKMSVGSTTMVLEKVIQPVWNVVFNT